MSRGLPPRKGVGVALLCPSGAACFGAAWRRAGRQARRDPWGDHRSRRCAGWPVTDLVVHSVDTSGWPRAETNASNFTCLELACTDDELNAQRNRCNRKYSLALSPWRKNCFSREPRRWFSGILPPLIFEILNGWKESHIEEEGAVNKLATVVAIALVVLLGAGAAEAATVTWNFDV